jgi:hypothetical protein
MEKAKRALAEVLKKIEAEGNRENDVPRLEKAENKN